MSSKGIFTAVSGAIAQSQKLDTISNNLANANTTAFKRDEQAFREYLTAYEKQQGVIEVPKVPASIESFYDMQGADRSYVDVDGTFTQFTQGDVRATGNDMDLAIEGRGFFEVLTGNGIRFTRNGSFVIDQEGRLATKEGHLVLSEGANQPLEDRIINFDARGKVQVSPDGIMLQNGEEIGRIALANISNLQALKKEGSSLFALKDNMEAQVLPAENIKIHQGHLEASNVNIVKEMTDLISTTRLFETTQKAIQAYDKMEQILANDVSRLD